jgi:hypothetical protein
LKGTTTLATGTWLTVDAAGDVFIDTNVRDEKEFFIKYTWAYDSATANTLDFKVTVACPTLTIPVLLGTYTHLFTPNGATTLAASFAGTAYAVTSTALST